MASIIGIDLTPSTSHSAVWDVKARAPVIIPNRWGNLSTPSLLSFAAGRVCAGEDAEPFLLSDPDTTLYPLSHNADAHLPVRVGGHEFDLTLLTACLLYHLRQCAETRLGEPVMDAVLTCPVHYGQVQRNRLRNAARIAGLNVHRILERSTAAAMVHGWRNVPADDLQNLVVCHMDDDGLDVCTIQASHECTVLSTASDAHPETFSLVSPLVEWMEEQARGRYGLSYKKDGAIPSGVISAAREAIQQLAFGDSAWVSLPAPKSASLEITRQQFEQLSQPMLLRAVSTTEKAVKEVVEEIEMEWKEFEGILLSGSCARQPMLQKALGLMYRLNCPATDPQIYISQQPELDAAIGAAVLASSCAPIGIPPESALSDRQLAQARHQVESPPADDILLDDIISHTLGIELADHKFFPVVKKKWPLPDQTELTFSNSENAAQMMASIFEGEEENVLENRKVGDLIISVAPLPAGQHNIQIRFTMETTGELSFDCTDLRLGEPVRFYLTPALEMGEEEITHHRRQIEAVWAEQPTPAPKPAPAHSPPGVPPMPTAPDPQARLRALTSSVPDEWRDTCEQCLALLPSLAPARQALLRQALQQFSAALQGANPSDIDQAGFALQDALLKMMF